MNQSSLVDIIYGIGEENKIYVLRGNDCRRLRAAARGEVIMLFCLRPDEIGDVRESSKISEFFENSPLSEVEKTP